MFNRVKTLLQIKSELDQINSKFDSQKEVVQNLTNEISGLKSQIFEAKKEQEQFIELHKLMVTNLRSNVGEINDIHKQYKEELDKFFLIKKEITSKIMQRFENELAEQLVTQSERLEIKTDNYVNLKRDIEKIASSITTLNSEIVKLRTISSSIKAGDFELKQFAKELALADRHKLELMQKIDSLQRLVSKLRRR